MRAKHDDKGHDGGPDGAGHLPVAQVPPHAPEVLLEVLFVQRFWVARREEHEHADGDGDQRQRERAESAERSQHAAGRVARGAHGGDAGVGAKGRRAFAYAVSVPDHRHVQGTQRRGPHPLKSPQDQQVLEAAGKDAGPAGAPKRRRAGTRIFLRPWWSDSTPSIGVSTTPGRVKTVISNPTCPPEIPNSPEMAGNAGVKVETPSTATNVTPRAHEGCGRRRPCVPSLFPHQ